MRIESRKVKAHEVKMGDRTGLFADWIVEEIRYKKAPRNAPGPYEVEIYLVHRPVWYKPRAYSTEAMFSTEPRVEAPQWHRYDYNDEFILTTRHED